ncbi:hypothetical protein [Nostoc sp. CHAB 5715]|uniref:hypothetical protein n=1 Tax=Nostoc sp. CHAB 5715 TaxID=2780400 RepID=UPI001E3865F2|nr:hypothetical protein [Nostoc sp. CHAB 5715]MCC5626288.1 hypothetical protein [Nostoc sp. CHAB 5715]
MLLRNFEVARGVAYCTSVRLSYGKRKVMSTTGIDVAPFPLRLCGDRFLVFRE